jgi:bacteriocin resistance YdeI/OmpD-like protein/uncharacterized protein DUF1905
MDRRIGQTNRMPGRRCTVVIESRGGGGSAAPLPFDPKEAFGRARAPVRVTVEAEGQHEPFRTTIAIYEGKGWIGFRKAQLAEFGLSTGDQVDLLVELDTEPREVDVPPELAAALSADPVAASAFDALSYTHRREYARWVAEAKRDATRADRAAKSVERLRAGVKTPL